MQCDRVFAGLYAADGQLRNVDLLRVNSFEGYSLKKVYVSVPVAHDLKQLLRHYVLDFILLSLPGGASRDRVQARVLASAHCKSFFDQFYSYKAYQLFLNNRDKWDEVPHLVKLLIFQFEIIADQAVGSEVTEFHIASYAFGIYLYESTARLIQSQNLLYPATKSNETMQNQRIS